ncbi:MAG: hypothetical protein WCY82_09165, partial [Desulfotomaculaceae bacterium]
DKLNLDEGRLYSFIVVRVRVVILNVAKNLVCKRLDSFFIYFVIGLLYPFCLYFASRRLVCYEFNRLFLPHVDGHTWHAL